jgi:trehalose-6-phosphatase
MLNVYQGPMAWEATPAIGWHKGSAVRAIAEAVGDEPLVLYAGDSANDAEALEAAAERGGVSIGVGPIAPPAQYRVDGPEEIREFLIGLLAVLGDHKASA